MLLPTLDLGTLCLYCFEFIQFVDLVICVKSADTMGTAEAQQNTRLPHVMHDGLL